MAQARAARLEAVELLRVLAIGAVIVIHATPFNRAGQLGKAWNAATIANQLARIAVPAFFVLSGYFWALRTPTPQAVRAVTVPMVGRLLLLFAAWSVVYVLPYVGILLPRPFPSSGVQGFGEFDNIRDAMIQAHQVSVTGYSKKNR